MLSSTIIPTPANDKDFEEKCVPLFAGLLNDRNVKTLGARGQNQWGLDLLGARDRDPAQPVGVQCKLKTKGGKLTEKEIRKEVDQALTVRPKLTEYYIVTTASDDSVMDTLAMTLRQEQAAAGRQIEIYVWGWDFLQQKIRADANAREAFDPGHSPAIARMLEMTTETHLEVQGARAEQQILVRTVQTIAETLQVTSTDPGHGDALDALLDAQVDEYRDLLNAGQPRTAFGLLSRLETQLTATSSGAIRARVRANLAWAKLRLGEETAAGSLFLEAYVLNPGNPKIVSNRVLGMILTGDIAGAAQFAQEALRADETNEGVAALVFHIATLDPTAIDPIAITPAALLDDVTVRFHRISRLRAQGEAQAWRELAAETLAKFPADEVAIRTQAEAWIDEALEARAFERNPVLPPANAEMLTRGAAMLAELWDKTRAFENREQDYLVAMGVNLANAYRALNDAVSARRVTAELVALSPDAVEVAQTAFHLALDDDDIEAARVQLARLPDGPLKTLNVLNLAARDGNWRGLLDTAGQAERSDFIGEDLVGFDVLSYRARCRLGDVDIVEATDQLLAAHPESAGAHVVAADTVRLDNEALCRSLLATALDLLGPDSNHGERLMAADLAGLLNDTDALIQSLDGFVATDRMSGTLAKLAWAFANGPPRPRTKAFFASLPKAVIETPEIARLAGLAESMRGDLAAAEGHLRRAVALEPSDLRGHLVLESVLRRQRRAADADTHMLSIDELTVVGDPLDKVRLAYAFRRAGSFDRALALGYSTVRARLDVEAVVAAYPALILAVENMPRDLFRADRAEPDRWFRLTSPDRPDVQGVIESGGSLGQGQYDPSHPLAAAMIGKAVGETFVLRKDVGPDQIYELAELKHKYVWLLHDIMAAHGTRFPDSNALVTMTMGDGDIQPILDAVKVLSEGDRQLEQTYVEHPVPLAAIAAMSQKTVIELAEHLVRSGIELRTCAGNQAERERAQAQTRKARGQGAVLDTLTLWVAYQLDLLQPLKAHFGRLVIARSTMDTLLELQEGRKAMAGKDFMTLGFQGDQAFRDVHTPEDTQKAIDMYDRLIATVEEVCEIAPVDGADDMRLDSGLFDRFAAAQVLDPIHLARAHKLFLLSDELQIRQLAAEHGAAEGGWLQVAARVLTDRGLIAEEDYCIHVGQFAALRHSHVWLDAATLAGIRQLNDVRREPLFEAALRYIGGSGADVASHVGVVLEFMRAAVRLDIEPDGSGQAMSALIARLIADHPLWRDILRSMLVGLGAQATRGDRTARRVENYLRGWIRGHFLGEELAHAT
jgi:tetratricopeptide (TPR) repeat protein